MTQTLYHRPVMADQVCQLLLQRSPGVLVDGTVGGGGHALALMLSGAGRLRLVGIDRDPAALEAARARLYPFLSRVNLVQGLFSDIERILASLKLSRVSGVLLDLGVSSRQLESVERGFSFREDGPLDMRMDPGQALTAGHLINTMPEGELADLLYRYGDDRASRRIARSIVRYRQKKTIETTGELAGIIRKALGGKRGKIDPATRSFQALRIVVNRELDELSEVLKTIPRVLEPEGMAVILSYHSLEDRIVKHAFRDNERLIRATKKPVFASIEEVRVNPRSRSARLRAAFRILSDEGETRE